LKAASFSSLFAAVSLPRSMPFFSRAIEKLVGPLAGGDWKISVR
jgi:hypothetical protein